MRKERLERKTSLMSKIDREWIGFLVEGQGGPPKPTDLISQLNLFASASFSRPNMSKAKDKGKGKKAAPSEKSEFKTEDILQAVLLADSFSVKLRPITKERPKVIQMGQIYACFFSLSVAPSHPLLLQENDDK